MTRILALVLLICVASPAWALTFQHASGWSVEVLDEVGYWDMRELVDAELGDGFAFERAMLDEPGATYFRCILRSPTPGIVFGPSAHFVAVVDSARVGSSRILFGNGLREGCTEVYGTDGRPVLLTRVYWATKGKDRGAPCVIQFPERVRLDDTTALEFSFGGGE